MRCLICHRPLSDPESVRRGIGPICFARKIDDDLNHGPPDASPALRWDPETGDVICERDPDDFTKKRFNIAHVLVKHSPTGMEWGYGGSGPADFALNILYAFTDAEFAQRHYQAFKATFVASLPEAGGTIAGSAIRWWIEVQKLDDRSTEQATLPV